MIELIAELDAASKLLGFALDRYLGACSTIQEYCSRSTTGVPQILPSCIVEELASASLRETKIKRARSVLGQVKNGCTQVTPVHTLPPEILSRIFLLVLGTPYCARVDSSKSRYMPRYPDFLSHICSHWRRIAIDSPALWTHVDLVYYHSSNRRYVDRAKVFASRSGPLPLQVHIRAPKALDRWASMHGLFAFLPLIAARTESLQLTTPSTVKGFEHHLFERIFEILQPATLIQISITDYSKEYPACLYASNSAGANDTAPNYPCHRLEIPYKIFEATLLLVKELRLDGLYFHWGSKAYHGLVELHLESPRYRDCTISATQLHRIFESSPKLAKLYFRLHLFDDGWRDHGIEPAHLESLEVLNVLDPPWRHAQLETLLSLFTPGEKPLRLTIGLGNNQVLSNPSGAVARFLKHGNVTELCVLGESGPLIIENLSDLVPRLRVLVLNGHDTTLPVGPFVSVLSQIDPPILDTLYLHQGSFDLNSLCLLAKRFTPKAMIFWKAQVHPNVESAESSLPVGSSSFAPGIKLEDDQVRAALSDVCPVIYRIDRHLDIPIKSWCFQRS